MRVEKRGREWFRTWAFKIPERQLMAEGFDKVKVSSELKDDAEYPGCPYCHTTGFFKCGKCGKLNCYSGEKVVTCGWCGNKGEVVEEAFEMDGGGY